MINIAKTSFPTSQYRAPRAALRIGAPRAAANISHQNGGKSERWRKRGMAAATAVAFGGMAAHGEIMAAGR